MWVEASLTIAPQPTDFMAMSKEQEDVECTIRVQIN